VVVLPFPCDQVSEWPVIKSIVKFAYEVVHLDLALLATDPFPVHFVQILRLKNDGGDDTLTLGGGHLNLNISKVQEAFRLDSWTSFILGSDCEFGTAWDIV
jgi:hypothetical protein